MKQTIQRIMTSWNVPTYVEVGIVHLCIPFPKTWTSGISSCIQIHFQPASLTDLDTCTYSIQFGAIMPYSNLSWKAQAASKFNCQQLWADTLSENIIDSVAFQVCWSWSSLASKANYTSSNRFFFFFVMICFRLGPVLYSSSLLSVQRHISC